MREALEHRAEMVLQRGRKRHSNAEGVGPDQGFFKAGEESTV